MYHTSQTWNVKLDFFEPATCDGFGLADVCSSEAHDDAVLRSAADTIHADLLTSLINLSNRQKRVVFCLTLDTIGGPEVKANMLSEMNFPVFFIMFFEFY